MDVADGFLKFKQTHDIFFQFAYLAGSKSMGSSPKIGVCVVRTVHHLYSTNKLVAVGWNDVPVGCDPSLQDHYKYQVSAVKCALIFCSAPPNECTMYVTKRLTLECAKIVAMAGIRRVVYVQTEDTVDNYKMVEELLEKANVEVLKYETSDETKTLAKFLNME